MLCTLELSNIPLSDGKSTSTTRTPDEQLIAAIAKGDRRAMERLFTHYSRAVYQFLYRLTHDAALADDLVSDVFLGVWRGAATFKGRSRVSTWIFAIARNKALTATRRHTPPLLQAEIAETIPDDAADPELNSHRLSRKIVMQRCLALLPACDRELLDLAYYHEKTMTEVAEIVGIPQGTVKSRMAAARNRLGGLLQQAGLDREQAY